MKKRFYHWRKSLLCMGFLLCLCLGAWAQRIAQYDMTGLADNANSVVCSYRNDCFILYTQTRSSSGTLQGRLSFTCPDGEEGSVVSFPLPDGWKVNDMVYVEKDTLFFVGDDVVRHCGFAAKVNASAIFAGYPSPVYYYYVSPFYAPAAPGDECDTMVYLRNFRRVQHYEDESVVPSESHTLFFADEVRECVTYWGEPLAASTREVMVDLRDRALRMDALIGSQVPELFDDIVITDNYVAAVTRRFYRDRNRYEHRILLFPKWGLSLLDLTINAGYLYLTIYNYTESARARATHMYADRIALASRCFDWEDTLAMQAHLVYDLSHRSSIQQPFIPQATAVEQRFFRNNEPVSAIELQMPCASASRSHGICGDHDVVSGRFTPVLSTSSKTLICTEQR